MDLRRDAQEIINAALRAAQPDTAVMSALKDIRFDKGGRVVAVSLGKAAWQMAKAASEQSGWMVRRVSLRNRNPKATPDAWERTALEEFDRRAAAGENPATLEAFAIVEKSDGKEARYMKALPVQQVCLACHGPADKLTPEVSAKLRALYPEDKGVGYNIGQIRGAMTIRKAM